MAGDSEAKETRKRAQGRTLAEFGALGPAEQKLLEACRIGEYAQIAVERPKKKTSDNSLRPAFVRFLALGGDDDAPMHEKGLQLCGAWIDGEIDFECCRIGSELALFNCVIAGKLNIRSANLYSLILAGSVVKGIEGANVRCRGSLHLGKDFHATDLVYLSGARISGNLECNGSRLEVTTGEALNCDQIETGGSIYLNDHFHATGEVRMPGAQIGSDLVCSKGRFDGAGGWALSCDGIETSGGVFFSDGFHATGEVRLLGARIGGDLVCLAGRFETTGQYSLICNRAQIEGALDFRTVEKSRSGKAGIFAFVGAHASTLTDDAASWETASALVLDGFTYDRIAGVPRTDLPRSRITSIAATRVSESHTVGLPSVELSPRTINTDGPPRDARTRIVWLDRQMRRHLDQDFRPQPWQQLARVLMEMGNEDDARAVLIEMRKRRRASRWKYYDDRCERRKWFLRTRFDWLIGFFVAYGYRPDRAICWLVGLWLVGGLIYYGVAPAGIIAPTDAHFYLDPRIPAECKVDWIGFTGPRLPTNDDIAKVPENTLRLRLQKEISDDADQRREEARRVGLDAMQDWSWKTICNRAVPSEYSAFQPFVYSVDIMLPFLELRQERDFAPRTLDDKGNVLRPLFALPDWLPFVGGTWGLGYLVRLWEWLEIFFGWTLTILIAASVSGIIKKD